MTTAATTINATTMPWIVIRAKFAALVTLDSHDDRDHQNLDGVRTYFHCLPSVFFRIIHCGLLFLSTGLEQAHRMKAYTVTKIENSRNRWVTYKVLKEKIHLL